MRVLVIDPYAVPDSTAREHTSKLLHELAAWRFDRKADLAADVLDVEAYLDAFKYNVVLVCDSEHSKLLIKRIRFLDSQAAVIVLSPIRKTEHVVACLNWGADDYLCMPIAMAELVARMKTIVLRHRGFDQHIVQCGPIRIDFDAQRWIAPKGEPIHLQPALWKVLECLVLRAGEVCSREDIINHMYGSHGCEHDADVIDTFVCQLRRIFGTVGISKKTIESSHGVGYRINVNADGPTIPTHNRIPTHKRGRLPRKQRLEAAE